MMGGRPADITVGGACAFQLPHGLGCAAQARSLLSSAMTALGLPRELVEDGELAVSELATNAFQHAGGTGRDGPATLPELWVWARVHPAPQLVVSVFDADPTAMPQVSGAGPLEEYGKGLGIVAAVSACWGCRRSRCRLGNRPAGGKATWFALPLPGPWPTGRTAVGPSAAAQELVCALAARGIDGNRRSDDTGISIVHAGRRNVWVRPGTFCWRDGTGGYVQYPLADLQEVVEHLVSDHESDAGRPPARSATRRSM
jgi:hypothetical protein